MNPQLEDIWGGQYKIPWNDAAFSRRMLREHLSQEHDLASRRTDWIDKHVNQAIDRLPQEAFTQEAAPLQQAHQRSRRGRRSGPVHIGEILPVLCQTLIFG